MTNTAFLPTGALVVEVSPRGYYENDFPSMFALQNRDADFVHKVVFAVGHQGRKSMPFNAAEVYNILIEHLKIID